MEAAERMDKKYVYEEKLLGLCCRRYVSVLSFSKQDAFLEHAGVGTRSNISELYRLFTFETIHELQLSISQNLKESILAYVSSDTIFEQPDTHR